MEQSDFMDACMYVIFKKKLSIYLHKLHLVPLPLQNVAARGTKTRKLMDLLRSSGRKSFPRSSRQKALSSMKSVGPIQVLIPASLLSIKSTSTISARISKNVWSVWFNLGLTTVTIRKLVISFTMKLCSTLTLPAANVRSSVDDNRSSRWDKIYWSQTYLWQLNFFLHKILL